MELSGVYRSVSGELKEVEEELKVQMKDMYELHAREREDLVFLEGIVNHVFQVPGKRLRPILVLLSARAAWAHAASASAAGSPGSADERVLVRLATAAELIHTASLIHDDVIDHSSCRRARPSLNKAFDIKYAVLAGDILYAQFFSLLAGLRIDTGRYRRVLEIFCSVTREMCQGEIFEHRMKSSPCLPAYGGYLEVIKSKTASLMSASCQSGAIVAGAGPALEGKLKEYGLHIGLSYQLVDDLLDEDFPVATDTDRAERTGESVIKAKEALKGVKDSEYRQSLLDLADYVIDMLPTKR
jgi:octaprenyl-diphosphate synthase